MVIALTCIPDMSLNGWIKCCACMRQLHTIACTINFNVIQLKKKTSNSSERLMIISRGGKGCIKFFWWMMSHL